VRNAFHVLCVDENGALNIYTISRKKKLSGPKQFNSQITVDNDEKNS